MKGTLPLSFSTMSYALKNKFSENSFAQNTSGTTSQEWQRARTAVQYKTYKYLAVTY